MQSRRTACLGREPKLLSNIRRGLSLFMDKAKQSQRMGTVPVYLRTAALLRCFCNNNGLSLVEMLIVIAIIGILLGIATLQFSQWNTKYNIESQTKEMYSDLMETRVNAMSRNRSHIFRLISATQYQTMADLNGDGDYDDTVNGISETGTIKTLKNQIQWNGAVPSNSDVTFNSKGLATTSGTISVATNTVGAVYDCIVISWTRINMGLMSGGNCEQK